MQKSLIDKIEICRSLRSWMAEAFCHVLVNNLQCTSLSEKDFVDQIRDKFRENTDIYPAGWYDPPPGGVSALFAKPPDYRRSFYDTLRKEEFWPKPEEAISLGGIGLIYASPIHRQSLIIGDFGMTIYRGKDPQIIDHIAQCLDALEEAAEQAEAGMELRELHDLAQAIFKQKALTNARTKTQTDPAGNNLGHTVPFSYTEVSACEQALIKTGNVKALAQLISKRRIHVNGAERFKIPDNIAFTFEARLESQKNPMLPNVWFHLILTFKDGKKSVPANFNKIFDALGMKDIHSRYS